MTHPQTEIDPQVSELCVEAMEAFCQDIAGMFGVDMASSAKPHSMQTTAQLSKLYKKLAALITVKATGVLQGNYYLIFDKEALFTLAGTIVMLPEQRIQTFRKTGTVKDAEELHDAVGETGNLLVGSWDRVFRENLEGHLHFLQTSTFVGDPWSTAKDTFKCTEEEFFFLPFEITIGAFPAFQCGVILPPALFDHPAEVPPAAPAEAQAPQPSPAPLEEIETPKAAELTDKSGPGIPAEAVEDPHTSAGPVSQTIQDMVRSLPVMAPGQARLLMDVCAGDIMQKKVLWGDPDHSVQQAMEAMQQADAPCMMVGKDGILEGIVAWIDIAEAVSIYLRPMFGKWRRSADDATLQIKLRIMMSRPVRTVRADTTLAVLLEQMCHDRMRCLPVADAQGCVLGVVSAFDIFRFLLNACAGSAEHPVS